MHRFLFFGLSGSFIRFFLLILSISHCQIVLADPPIVSSSSLPNGLVDVNSTERIQVSVTDRSGTGLDKVELWIGGSLVHTDNRASFTYRWRPTELGRYYFLIRAYDNNGELGASGKWVKVVKPLRIQLDRPRAWSRGLKKEDLLIPGTFEVRNSGDSSEIKSAEIFIDDVLLGSRDQPPFTFDWTPEELKDYDVRVKAVSEHRQERVITTGVAAYNYPPKIYITKPSPGDQVIVGVNNRVEVLTIDEKPLSKVEYYVDGKLEKTVTAGGGHTWFWQPTSTGKHLLYAIAYERNRSRETRSETITVEAISQNGFITKLERPSAQFETIEFNKRYVLSAFVNSINDIEKVLFYVDDEVVCTVTDVHSGGSARCNWWPEDLGNSIIQAKAFDDQGRTQLSRQHQVSIVNGTELRSVRFNTDQVELIYRNPFTFKVPNDLFVHGFSEVNFYLEDQLVQTQTAGPFEYYYAPEELQNNASLRVEAIQKYTGEKHVIHYTLIPPPEPIEPIVFIDEPEDHLLHDIGRQEVFLGDNGWHVDEETDTEGYISYGPTSNEWAESMLRVKLRMAVDDIADHESDLIATVELVEESTQEVIDSGPIYRKDFNRSQETLNLFWHSRVEGREQTDLSIRVYWHGLGTLFLDSIEVRPVPLAHAPPFTNITYPKDNTLYEVNRSMTIWASASDQDGIDRVEFYVDGLLLGESSSGHRGRYSYPWTPTEVKEYSIQVKAYDKEGDSSLSESRIIQVESFPEIKFVTPNEDWQPKFNKFNAINVNASDPDGIERVEFYIDRELVATDTITPYSMSWRPKESRSYDIWAVAYDTRGAQRFIEARTVVPEPIDPPAIKLTKPESGELVIAGQPFRFEAEVSDNDELNRVQFSINFLNGIKIRDLGESSASSSNNLYRSWSWRPESATKYLLKVEAEDETDAIARISKEIVVINPSDVTGTLSVGSCFIQTSEQNCNIPIKWELSHQVMACFFKEREMVSCIGGRETEGNVYLPVEIESTNYELRLGNQHNGYLLETINVKGTSVINPIFNNSAPCSINIGETCTREISWEPLEGNPLIYVFDVNDSEGEPLGQGDRSVVINLGEGTHTLILKIKNSQGEWQIVSNPFTIVVEATSNGGGGETPGNTDNISIFSEDFESRSIGGLSQYSVYSDADWGVDQNESYFAKMNGYGADDASEDWLILPSINLNNYQNEFLRFESAYQYRGPMLKLMYSKDYEPDYDEDPYNASWQEIPECNQASNSLCWNAPEVGDMTFNQSEIDISKIEGNSVHFAFVYESYGTRSGDAATWAVDNIFVGYTKQTGELYEEDFEQGIPEQWTVWSESSNQNWSAGSRLRKNSAVISGYGADEASNDWLITSAVNVDSAESLTLTFDYYRNYTGPGIKVFVSTNYSKGISPLSVDWAEINLPLTDFSNDWKTIETIDLSSYKGNVYVAFVYQSTGTKAGDGASVGIDNVKLHTLIH